MSTRATSWKSGEPIRVDLRIEYPDSPEGLYGQDGPSRNYLDLRNRVDDVEGLVAKIREYADHVAVAWGLEGQNDG